MIIVDTREPFEYEQSHVEGAINIPPMQFMQGEIPKALKDTDKDEPILLYCRSGQRSNTCGMILKSLGYTNIINGINEHHATKITQQHEDK